MAPANARLGSKKQPIFPRDNAVCVTSISSVKMPTGTKKIRFIGLHGISGEEFERESMNREVCTFYSVFNKL